MSKTPEQISYKQIPDSAIDDARTERDAKQLMDTRDMIRRAVEEYRDSLTADDAIAIARERGHLVQAWQRGDIEGVIENLVDTDDDWKALSMEQTSEIVAAAQKTRSWRMLADATETDWAYIHNAINAAAEELGHSVRA